MATPTRLRNDLRSLTTLAERDLAKLWQQVTTAATAQQALNDILPALIETYGVAAAAMASDWYDDARLKAGVGGSFRAFPIELPDHGAYQLSGWALTEAQSLTTARTLVAGGVQRRIANAARYTVARSSIADPRARGWKRVGDGSSCTFCSMLLGRGAVYTEVSAQFKSHDHCGCTAAPAF